MSYVLFNFSILIPLMIQSAVSCLSPTTMTWPWIFSTHLEPHTTTKHIKQHPEYFQPTTWGNSLWWLNPNNHYDIAVMSLCYERIPFHPDQTLGLSENRVRYPSLPLPSHCLKAHFPHQHCNNLGSEFRKTQGTLIGQFLFPWVNLNHYDFVGTIPTSHAAGCTKGEWQAPRAKSWRNWTVPSTRPLKQRRSCGTWATA